MKTLATFLMFTVIARGGEEFARIELKNGTVLKDATVREKTEGGLKILHSTGVGIYRLDLLPEAVRRKCAPTPEEEKEDAEARKKAGGTPDAIPAAPVIRPGITRAELATLWGAAAGDESGEATDWELGGMAVTVIWKNGAADAIQVVAAGGKAWPDIARVIKMDRFKSSAAATLTPLRSAWTLSDDKGVKWNATGTRSARGAETWSVVRLTK